MVYLNDDPDRAPRLNGTELHVPADRCTCGQRPTRSERAAWWACFAYLAVVVVSVAACGIGGAVWVWTRALHS